MFIFSELTRYEKVLKKYACVKNTIDYHYKSKVLFDNVNSYIKSVHQKERYSDLITDDIDYSLRDWLSQTFGFCEILESYRINNAYYHRVARLKSRICQIVTKRSYFLTLTWTDDFLKPNSDNYLSEYTRRKYIQRFLKSISSNYVANIDYGETYNREHYHAVVQADYIDSHLWKYGNLDFKLITYTDNDCIQLAEYTSKLVNHAVKSSSKRECVIYSRVKKEV